MSRNKLEQLMKKMQKEHGAGSFRIASDTEPYCSRIPTGIYTLDYATGGGIPIGRTSMVFGKRSAGKSALCAQVTANAQRLCRKCYKPVIMEERDVEFAHKSFDLKTGKIKVLKEIVHRKVPIDCVSGCRVVEEGKRVPPGRMQVIWADAEGSFTPDFYTKFGVDCPDVFLSTPDYGEAVVDMVDVALREGEADLIIVDSLAHMTPMKEREKSAEDSLVAIQARLINRAMRQWTSSLNEIQARGQNDCAILLVNQIREKMGGYYTAEVRPGGMGQEFATSIDIRLKQKEFKYDASGRPLWMSTEFTVEKNRVGVPKMQGLYRMCLLEHPGRLPGDTWDDEAVSDAAFTSGLAVFEEGDKTKGLVVLERKFTCEQEFRDEITKKGDFYALVREAALNAMIFAPSDGKEPEKKKKKGEKGEKEED